MGLAVDYVKVLDFGLVKSDSRSGVEQARLTAVDVISGTPAFMAPEMINGEEVVGPPADVYALGCVAYWLLTGKYVFEAPNPTAMLMRHLTFAPEPPSASAPSPIPEALDAVVLDCLAKDPLARPANAVALHKRLAELSQPDAWTEEMARQWWSTNMAEPLPPDPQPDTGQLQTVA
jgi:serine/threonine-protein kinase